jgi:hypothetical protein
MNFLHSFSRLLHNKGKRVIQENALGIEDRVQKTEVSLTSVLNSVSFPNGIFHYSEEPRFKAIGQRRNVKVSNPY